MGRNILKEKSYAFAFRVVKFYRYLCERHEYVLSKQVLRSGAAVGALVSEAEFGQSKADFISKYETRHRGADKVACIKHQNSETK